ncbi:aldo/keto reductase [Nonomuraea cypriaca]|uniref:aldo/keto reductase n=1 Tax=Nonomuraea cypriaca TaxID=1187855 RepID=UPI001A9C677B|nr:aldo/keto reductase [Nonomuraea cypriaca]
MSSESGVQTPAAKVDRIRAVCRQYGISVKAAALQFSLAHPAARAAIPGSTKPDHVAEDVAAISERIPAEFWTALRQERLIAPDAPVPTT